MQRGRNLASLGWSLGTFRLSEVSICNYHNGDTGNSIQAYYYYKHLYIADSIFIFEFGEQLIKI